MVPLAHADNEGSYLDYEQKQFMTIGSNSAREGYQIEPLVLGESAAPLNQADVGFGDMLPNNYDNELICMEPSYLNNWNTGNWYEECTPRATQESFETLSSNKYDITPEYAAYNQGTPYASIDQGAGSASSRMMYEASRSGSYASVYQLPSCEDPLSRMNSIEAGGMHPMSGSVESYRDIGSLDSGSKSLCGSYESTQMQSSSVESNLRDLSRMDANERNCMNEYPPRNEAPLMMHGSNMQQVQAPSTVITPRGDGNRELCRVSTDDLTTFNTHFEDLCKPMKRVVPLPQQLESDIFERPPMAHFRVPPSENTVNMNQGQQIPPNFGYYDQSGHKMPLGPQPNCFVHPGPGFICEGHYQDGQKNAMSTPTLRSKVIHSRPENFGNGTPDLTTYQSDAYNNVDVENMKTPCMDPNAVYNVHPGQVDGYHSGRMDKKIMDQFALGLVEPTGGAPSEAAGCGSIRDLVNIPLPGSEVYCEQLKAEAIPQKGPMDHYDKPFMEEIPRFKPKMVKPPQEDSRRFGVDGVDHFGGIIEAFKDDENFHPEIDAMSMRRLFENNRYIEDLGNQYEMSRDDGPCGQVAVYIRTNITDEFGAYQVHKELVSAAPTASSSELCEVLLACSNVAVTYHPTITWDPIEQGYAVNWWSSDDKGGIIQRQSRLFTVAEFGKGPAYEEAIRFAKIAETMIRPGSLIRWYPGFNIPIGTSGRTNLRKVLHMYRMKNPELCDPVLAANGMKIATKSTFGDMTIVELYKAAYVLGLWDVAAYNCLNTCKRRSYSYRWIHQLQSMNRRITLDALKYLRNVKEALAANRRVKRASRGPPRRLLR